MRINERWKIKCLINYMKCFYLIIKPGTLMYMKHDFMVYVFLRSISNTSTLTFAIRFYMLITETPNSFFKAMNAQTSFKNSTFLSRSIIGSTCVIH